MHNKDTKQDTDQIKDSDSDSENATRGIKSTLVSRNITILGNRTSIRLEPEMWRAIHDIAHKEGCSIHELCSLVYLRKEEKATLTAAIRVFLMLYYRAAATPEGHQRAGHGDFATMKKRARVFGDLRTSAASLLRPNQDKTRPAANTSKAPESHTSQSEEAHA